MTVPAPFANDQTMKRATLPLQEIEAIATTRFALGFALLLSHHLTHRQRRWAGWNPAVMGALTTPLLVCDVYQRRMES